MFAMGHGGDCEPSVGGGKAGMDEVEHAEISWDMEVAEGPARE